MKTLNVLANINQLDKVLSFVNLTLDENNCSIKVKMQIDVAVEVSCEICEKPLSIVVGFTDSGKSHNPLMNLNPDITVNAEEREVGGLGVLIVKKLMDNVIYEYKNGVNILTITKNI